MPEANDNDAILFGFDRFVNVPARGKVGQKIGHPSKLSDGVVVESGRKEGLNRTPCHSLDASVLSGSSSPHTVMASTTQRPIVFMDVNIGETPAGRLKMELFSDIVPKYVALGPVP